ncbi:hypothetical protein MNBD_GAMMA12-1015 [hydrothermal vent metagenome]|uniref:Copper metallochaperone, bacterial analog of Cox17 protein n=1 Tax=hydrothermal vent metagenome TaxID=652676 RepID=A0A3B0Z3R6_9ZZZZ
MTLYPLSKYFLSAFLFISASSIATSVTPEKNKITLIFSQGKVPLSPLTAVMAGYIKIKNTASDTIIFKKFTSPQFSRVEVHQTISKDNMLSMQQQHKVIIPSHSTIEFKSGGFHFMLIQAKHRLKSGQIVTITGETSKMKKYNFQLRVSP